jgi:hypothetical protein
MERIPVECIAEMKPDSIRPMRIRYEDREGKHVVNVDHVIRKDKKKIFAIMNYPESIEYRFTCETIEAGTRKAFALTFNAQTCRWHMYVN